jgi:hypothetical protein
VNYIFKHRLRVNINEISEVSFRKKKSKIETSVKSRAKTCTFKVKIFTMNASEIIKEIQNLPIQKRIYVIEKTIHSIRKEEDINQLKKAADTLLADYTTDKDLTSLTVLDFENFYETR